MLKIEDVKQASEILNINPSHIEEKDLNHVNEEVIFQNFLKEKKNNKNSAVWAKSILLIWLDEQLFQKGIPFRIPLTNYCYKCSGKGHQVEREKILSSVTCQKCEGTGIKTVPCKKCEGTGKIDGKSCATCKGTGKFQLIKNQNRSQTYYCERCEGTGQAKTVKQGPKIIDIKICSKCNGVGFDERYPTQVRSGADIGSKLRNGLNKRSKSNVKDFDFEVRRSLGMRTW